MMSKVSPKPTSRRKPKGAGAWSIVIIPMLMCGIFERTSKLRSPLKPDGGSLKFLSTYPSNMKLNSVPHCLRGEGGGGAGAGAAAGVCPAGALSGVCAGTAGAPPQRNPRTTVVQYVRRMMLLQSWFHPSISKRIDGALKKSY